MRSWCLCPVSECFGIGHDFGGDEITAVALWAAINGRRHGGLGEQNEDGLCGFGQLAAPEVLALAKALEGSGFCGVSEDAVMPDFDEAYGQDVLEEPAKELFAA